MSNLPTPGMDALAKLALVKRIHELEAEVKALSANQSANAAAAAAAPAAAAAAAAAPDEKAQPRGIVTLFGVNVKLSTPRALGVAQVADLQAKVLDLFGDLLEEIREQRAENVVEEDMNEDLDDLEGRLMYLGEKAAKEAAVAAKAAKAAKSDSDSDSDDDLDAPLPAEDKELFDIGFQICRRMQKYLKEQNFLFLPSVEYLWAMFEKFGMTLDNEEIREDAGWRNDAERKAKFARLLEDGPAGDNLEEDFPAVIEERQRRAQADAERQAKADAKRKAKTGAKGAKPSKRTKTG